MAAYLIVGESFDVGRVCYVSSLELGKRDVRGRTYDNTANKTSAVHGGVVCGAGGINGEHGIARSNKIN